MGSSDDPTPSVDIFKQLALTCEEIEVAVRSGQNVDLDTYVASFPLEYQDLIRPELEEVLAELRVPTGKKTSYPPDADYEALHEYSVLDQIAQGGMGRVLIAWDESFSRQVALKEIHPHSADDQRYQKRFLQESLITARLEHPGILPIYSLGVNSDDQPLHHAACIGTERKNPHPSDPRTTRKFVGYAVCNSPAKTTPWTFDRCLQHSCLRTQPRRLSSGFKTCEYSYRAIW